MKKFFICIVWLCSSVEAWTWTYSKKLVIPESKKRFSTQIMPTKPFTQLIFSWNALRPEKGYFRFYVQIHTQGGWSDRYKMLEWGSGVQKSYLQRADNKPSYHHVRLEMPKGEWADGVRITIEAHEGAILSLVHYIHCCLTNMQQFKAESMPNFSLKSIKIKNVPTISQLALEHEDNWRICSPTSLSMLLGYLKQEKIDPLIVAQHAYDQGLGVYGSWPFNLAHAYEQAPQYQFKVQRLASFHDLYQQLKRGFPVVVSVRGTIKGGAKPYDNGHLLVVVGWNNKKKHVIVHDPAFQEHDDVVREYPLEDFLKAWEKSHKLAYMVDYACA